MSFGKYKRSAKREAISSGIAAEKGRAQGAFVADQALNDDAFRNRLAGGLKYGADASPEALNRAVAGAVSAQAKIEADEVTAAAAVIKNMNLDRNSYAMRELSMGRSAGGLDGSNRAIRAAAMKQVVDSHDVDGVNRLLDNVGGMDSRMREHFADSLASSSEKPQYVSQSALTAIRQHGNTQVDPNTGNAIRDAAGNPIKVQAKNSMQLAIDSIQNNTYSTQKIAGGDKDELAFIADMAASFPGINSADLVANANKALTDPRFAGQISKNKDVVQAISQGRHP